MKVLPPLARGPKEERERRHRSSDRLTSPVYESIQLSACIWTAVSLLRIFIRAPAFLRIINCYSIESIPRNEMSQHLHVISRSFAKLRCRYALKKHGIERTMVLSVRSLVRHSVPRNYLLHLITDLRPLVAVNPYFAGLMAKINSGAARRNTSSSD